MLLSLLLSGDSGVDSLISLTTHFKNGRWD